MASKIVEKIVRKIEIIIYDENASVKDLEMELDDFNRANKGLIEANLL